MRGKTALQQVAETALGGPLEAYVVDRRRGGSSWRQISLELQRDTNCAIAPETLRLWFKDAVEAAA